MYRLSHWLQRSEITLGVNVEICSASEYTDLEVCHPAIIRILSRGSLIRIGDYVAQTRVVIGDTVLLGANVTIVDSDFHPLEPHGRRYTKEPSTSAPPRNRKRRLHRCEQLDPQKRQP